MQRIENHAPAHGVETKLEITPKVPLARFEFIAKLSQQNTSERYNADEQDEKKFAGNFYLGLHIRLSSSYLCSDFQASDECHTIQ